MLKILVSLCLLADYVQASGWEYTGNMGPEHWADHYDICGLQSQSPINIVKADAEKRTWDPFVWIGMKGQMLDESRPSSMQIINNGHTVQVNLKGDYFVSGGGLPSVYKAVQFHYHWGSESDHGSEHQLNGKSFPAEMHLVTYDYIRFESIQDAVDKPRGLAVFGSFIEVASSEDNTGLNELFDGVDEVEYNGETYNFESTFPLFPLMAGNKKVFYRYDGSLTTPPCYESVLWTVFEEPVTVSEKQMKYFRTVMQNELGEVVPETHPEPHETADGGGHPAGPEPDAHGGDGDGDNAGHHGDMPGEEAAAGESSHGDVAHGDVPDPHHGFLRRRRGARQGEDGGSGDPHGDGDGNTQSGAHGDASGGGHGDVADTGHDGGGLHGGEMDPHAGGHGDPHDAGPGTSGGDTATPGSDQTGDAGHETGGGGHETNDGMMKKPLVNNFRPVQPLNGRKVFVTFLQEPKAKTPNQGRGQVQEQGQADCESQANSTPTSFLVAVVMSILALFAS